MSVKQITTGQDSFLDIVANLVGVLIILVVVIGAQASSAWSTPEKNDETVELEKKAVQERLAATSDQLKSLETNNHEIESKIDNEVKIVANLTQLRHQMLVRMQLAEKEIEARKSARLAELDANQKSKYLREEQKNRLAKKLAELESEFNAIEAHKPESETIEHFPNPIAKTVFTDEIHFQIRQGKMAFVPFNELVSRMKSEWRFKAEKLRAASRTIETVGPIEDFRLQYELQSIPVDPRMANGLRGQRMVRFERFTIFPVSERIGEKITDEGMKQSPLAGHIRRFDPEKTTVSLWVYPDSFNEYNLVKNWLYENGYQVACWPLDFDRRISGGPNGFRTSAQ